MMRLGSAIVLLVLVSACRIQGAFECNLDEQCRDGDVLGTCRLERFCSFPDDTCDSQQRFADNAGDGLAGTCVGAEPVMEDAAVDAPPFDIALCPERYNRMIADKPGSRYRMITSQANVWTQAATCEADLPGATHLVVLDDTAELDGVRDMLPVFPPGQAAYVGVVQDPASTDPKVGWIHFDGRAAVTMWITNEPDNEGEPESARHANVAIVSGSGLAAGGLEDIIGTRQQAAVCECDGNPVHPMAKAFLDGDPSRP